MIVLGIESSCDETAAALLRDGGEILSSVVASQVSVHRDYGGVVPELASREHVDNICHVVDLALAGASLSLKQVEGVAATRGPGLIGALLVGLCYAKALAYALRIPFVGVNHLEGHLASIFLDHPHAELPALSLVVSGGHTNLYRLDQGGACRPLARTRDDAAGEALDKLAKMLGLGYPGGPVIDRLAPLGDPRAVNFSLPRFSDGSPDFSFSGIKTAALRWAREKGIAPVSAEELADPSRMRSEVLDLVASYQASVVDQILRQLERVLEEQQTLSIHVSGGVSCNSELRRRCVEKFEPQGVPVYFPRPSLTTDNAAMIAFAGAARLAAGDSDGWDLEADPNLGKTPGLRVQAPE